jgi:ethanolamine phosphate transferase 2 subunit G
MEIKDYTEVDNNVTRHLATEMSSEEWDVLILHYLGLDHIGHLEGPYSQKYSLFLPIISLFLSTPFVSSSPLLLSPFNFFNRMAPKIAEMDGVIEYMYSTLQQQNQETGTRSLLVVCSDHGMNEVRERGREGEREGRGRGGERWEGEGEKIMIGR